MVKRITFIATKMQDSNWYKYHPRLSPYTLEVLAGQVPEGWEPKIVDENIRPIDMSDDTDLAAITVPTAAAPRAYEIASEFRERGVPSLLGNIHPSILPDEAGEYGTVVAGEAVNILPRVLKDFENNRLQPYYYGGQGSLNSKFPRFDLAKDRYDINLVQYSSGCEGTCEFCSCGVTSGHTRRHKSHQRFVDEVNYCGGKMVFIADDNFLGYRKEDREDVKALLRKVKDETSAKFSAQVTVDFAKDNELLKLAADCGFVNVLIGFDALDTATLKEAGKFVNYKVNYRDVIRKLHDNGLTVCGTLIYGFDSHTKKVFPTTKAFVKDSGIDAARFEILTPFPGTRTEERLRRENRIFRNNYPEDWKFYNCTNVVYYPKNMTPEELEAGTLDSIIETSNPLESCVRAFKSLLNTRNIYGTVGSLWLNNATGLHARGRLRNSK